MKTQFSRKSEPENQHCTAISWAGPKFFADRGLAARLQIVLYPGSQVNIEGVGLRGHSQMTPAKCWGIFIYSTPRQYSRLKSRNLPSTVRSLRVTIFNKIWQRFRYHGIVYYYFAYTFGWKLKIYLVSLLRYGNPDVQILGALKIKLQIHRFLGILYNNMRFKIKW